MSDKPRFHIHVGYSVWTCGDGCCSEGQYEAELHDNGKLVWESHEIRPSEDWATREAIDQIVDILESEGNEEIVFEDIVEGEHYTIEGY